jgi:hypothetical protein
MRINITTGSGITGHGSVAAMTLDQGIGFQPQMSSNSVLYAIYQVWIASILHVQTAGQSQISIVARTDAYVDPTFADALQGYVIQGLTFRF